MCTSSFALKMFTMTLSPGLARFFALNGNFANEARGRYIRFFEMARHRLIHTLRFDEFDKSELHGIVAVPLLRLFLNNDTGTGLNDCDRNDAAIILQQLRHSDFLAQSVR